MSESIGMMSLPRLVNDDGSDEESDDEEIANDCQKDDWKISRSIKIQSKMEKMIKLNSYLPIESMINKNSEGHDKWILKQIKRLNKLHMEEIF